MQELEPLTAGESPEFGPMARLGEHLRIQAESGYRAAIIPLRPGLYLVGEVASDDLVMRPEFGIAFLAPLMINAAQKAINDPKGTQQTFQAVGSGASAAAKFLIEPPKQQPVAHPMALQAAHSMPMQTMAQMPQTQVVASPAAVAGWWAPPGVAGVPWVMQQSAAGFRPATWATEADVSGAFGGDGCGGRYGACPAQRMAPPGAFGCEACSGRCCRRSS